MAGYKTNSRAGSDNGDGIEVPINSRGESVREVVYKRPVAGGEVINQESREAILADRERL